MHFLITAGPTREYIDPVRYISNASSGQMGYALAKAAKKRGHNVTLISSVDLKSPAGVIVVKVETSSEMLKAVKGAFGQCDCLVMAAAVADYTIAKRSKTKIKKSKSELTIRLKPTVDILAWAGKNKKPNQIVVGFALEDRMLRIGAERKLIEKNLDMIIANTPAAIGKESSVLQIKTVEGKWQKMPMATKIVSAGRIIRSIEALPTD